MSGATRDSLKSLFRAGKLPRQQDFEGLIDSMLHMDDEGFRKSVDHGLQITSAVTSERLVTFYRKDQQQTPLWQIEHAATGDRLVFGRAGGRSREPVQALLTLDSDQCVGVAQADPEHTLHVGGILASKGRVGTTSLPPQSQPMADGRPHVLVAGLSGCNAFEVVASVRNSDGKRAALLHAVAVHAGRIEAEWPLWLDWLRPLFRRRNRIRSVDAWYGQGCDRLELRWQPGGEAGTYDLVVSTACDYLGSVPIQAHVTELWPCRPAGRTR